MDWADVVEREGRALGLAARRAPDAAVPSCPDWDVLKLARHVAFLHSRVTIGLRTGMADNPFRRDESLPGPPEVDIVEAYDNGLDALVAALRGIGDPSAPAWTFVGPGELGFWLRRMAHETTVHRVDAEQAAGMPVAPVEPAFAADGIDELLIVFGGASSEDAGRTVHLHATDVEGEWLVTFGPAGLTVDHGHAKGDTAIRGPVSDLFLWLWGRRPLDGLEVFGDPTLPGRLRTAATR